MKKILRKVAAGVISSVIGLTQAGILTTTEVVADSSKLYVDKTGTKYTEGTVYTTVTAALKDANAGDTIYIAPGTYRERITVDKANISFVNETPSEQVLLTWYYGTGCKYSSFGSNAIDTSTSASTLVTGSGFYAEGITFENSFNRYVTEEEIEDGLTFSTSSNGATERSTSTDVLSKTATERAIALYLNASAELKNCSLLSSQDTLYLSNGKAYLSDCKIQGQTDYIFNSATSTAVFDDCDLVWAGYSDSASESTAGYITAAQGTMLFRHCTISSNSTTNSHTVNVNPGYLGRHWKDGAKVIFADTINLNDDYLLASKSETAYFQSPSGLTKTDASSATEGYCITNADYSNAPYTAATVVSESKMTDNSSISSEDVAGETYLGNYKNSLKNYKFTDWTNNDKETVTWDFTSPSFSTDMTVSGNISATSDWNNSYNIYADIPSGGKIRHNDNSAQFSSGVVLHIPVTSTTDTIKVVSYQAGYSYYSIGGKDKSGTASSEYTADLTDVGQGYVELVSTKAENYIVSITLTKFSATKTASWDFQNVIPTSISSVDLQNKTGTVESNIEGISLNVDATSGKLAYRSSGDAQFNQNTVIQVPVYAVGDIITIVSYPGYHNYTVAGNSVENDTYSYTVKQSDIVAGYVEIKGTGESYIYSVTLKTNGNPAAKVKETEEENTETTTIAITDGIICWDFVNNKTDLGTIQKETGEVRVKGLNAFYLNVDATEGKMYNNTDSAQVNSGTVINIPVTSEKDIITIVPFQNKSYALEYTINNDSEPKSGITSVNYNVTSADVERGYVYITASNNGYLNSITLKMNNAFTDVESNTGNSKLYIFAKVAQGDVGSKYITDVGFIAAKSSDSSAFNDRTKATCSLDSVAKTINDGNYRVLTSESDYYAAMAISDLENNAVYVQPFTVLTAQDNTEVVLYGTVSENLNK